MFSVHSPNNMPEPAQAIPDSFASLLAPVFCTNTDAFLAVYRYGISESSDPVAALTRFYIEIITRNKSSTFSEHELISVTVKDEEKRESYNFYIIRNASRSETLVSRFPPSTPSLVSIFSSAVDSVKGRTQAVQTFAQPSELEFPLLALNTSSDSTSLVLPTPSQYSLGENLTLASTQVINSSATSFDRVAEDRILGRRLEVKPLKLSLYELGILVDVVHNEAPNYCLLQNQCYWFMGMIFNVISLLYSQELRKDPETMTPAHYLPNLCGRWKNLLIVAPKDEALRRVAIKFSERREELFSKVYFH